MVDTKLVKKLGEAEEKLSLLEKEKLRIQKVCLVTVIVTVNL